MQITMSQFLALNNVEKTKVLKLLAIGKIKIIGGITTNEKWKKV